MSEIRMNRDQKLKAEVVDDRLVVSIGVAALKTAVEGGDGWDQHGATIVDADRFARAIARALVEEDGEGSTDMHGALDLAADWVAEEGLDDDGLDR